MTTASTITSNEAQIRQLIADQQHAICAKNVDQIMSRYATEVIIFDVIPRSKPKAKPLFVKRGKRVYPAFPIHLRWKQETSQSS
ncbi:hypothetical protein NDA00_28465 [Funiculus sociatus GB2-M2]|uniref:hypothetical protein n=1 Tax=Cyanophyceae TaxID=3028117 RepID=UPI0018EF8C9F|nr:hypothetical protein [Trichocoleus sp. FACHB-90]